jgi:gliding motility-associated-like protein
LSVTSTDAYCGGRCYGTANVSPSGGTPPYNYIWNDPQNQTTQMVTGLCVGSFTVVITDSHGCTKTDTVGVSFSNYIPPLDATVSDSTIYEGQTVQIISTVYTNGTYTWNPPGGLNSTTISNPTATPPVSFITYVVEYVDSNGCENRDSVNIRVRNVTCTEPELFIPNAFTPNGDNNNEILYVRGNTIKELLFRIYNRWGEKVFETNNPGQGWDATYKGKPVMPGVYDYYFEATCFDNNKFFKKGNVTVIR